MKKCTVKAHESFIDSPTKDWPMTPTLPPTTQAQHMAHFNRLLEQFDFDSAFRYDRVCDYRAILRFMECKFGYYSNEASQFRYVCKELSLLTPEQIRIDSWLE